MLLNHIKQTFLLHYEKTENFPIILRREFRKNHIDLLFEIYTEQTPKAKCNQRRKSTMY